MICESPEETHKALRLMMVEGLFGEAGRHVVVEECLSGWEVSVLAFMDGKSFAMMPYTADHKRAFDGDQGPNTGGMGAYAPVQIDYPNFDRVLSEQILCPVLDGIARQGAAYIGVLYVGLMMTANGPYVLEFNCRFGDPETQVILPLLDSDLAEILIACTEGKLNPSIARWKDMACATVVLASGGYPGEYQVGLPITGLEQASGFPDVHIFHAGTTRRGSEVITSGGRVLAVSGLAETRSTALERAYSAAEIIQFNGVHYRRDIGRTAREAM
jgi:phosphoribosylamine--glycine ligase